MRHVTGILIWVMLVILILRDVSVVWCGDTFDFGSVTSQTVNILLWFCVTFPWWHGVGVRKKTLTDTLSKGRAGLGWGHFCWPWPWPSGPGHPQLGPGPGLGWGRVRADLDPLIFSSELNFFFSNAVILIFWLTFMYLLNSSVNYYLFTIKIEPLDLHGMV